MPEPLCGRVMSPQTPSVAGGGKPNPLPHGKEKVRRGRTNLPLEWYDPYRFERGELRGRALQMGWPHDFHLSLIISTEIL